MTGRTPKGLKPMTNLFQASQQWMSRPSDERFVSLTDLHARTLADRDRSVSSVISTRRTPARA